jgi:hypothetical protein
LLGPWGIISVFWALTVLLQNVINYLPCVGLRHRPDQTHKATLPAAVALVLTLVPLLFVLVCILWLPVATLLQ